MNRPRTNVNWRSVVRYLRNPSSDWKPKALLAVALLYLVWPIDLLPDFAPIIGWLDDLGLGGLAAWVVFRAASRQDPPQV